MKFSFNESSPCCPRANAAEQKLEEVVSDVANVLQVLDQMPVLDCDEGLFQECRDRLRKLLMIRPGNQMQRPLTPPSSPRAP